MARKAARKSAKTKKKTAARRTAKTGSVETRGVIGIVVLCIGLLSLGCQFVASDGGLLRYCTLITRGLGGTLCLLLPVVLCWAGVTLVFFGSGKLSAKTMVCGALIFLIVETMLQLFQISNIHTAIIADGKAPGYGIFLARSFQYASVDIKGGGLIGALLAWPLHQALDVWGTVIVLIFAATIVLMVFTGVSFAGLGMMLSEWFDDARVWISEQREERSALRASREEEELAREAELAEQRQQKRIERERREAELAAQKEAEEKAALAAAQQVQAADEKPQMEPPRKRKTKPKLEVVRAQEPAVQAEMPLDAPRPAAVKRTAPRPRPAERAEMPLYIERDEEFARESIEDRRERPVSRRRQSFTIEEAEHAFLYGSQTAPQQQAGPEPWAASEPQAEPEVYEQPVYEEPQQAEYVADVTAEQWNPAQEDGVSVQPALAAQDSVYTPIDLLGEETADEPQQSDEPFWKAHPDALIETYQEESAPQEAEEEDEPYIPAYAPVREEAPRAQAPVRRGPVAHQGQNVLAAQEQRDEDRTIVQLRGSRLDGTPIVMPKKDTHEAPKAEEAYSYPPIDLLNRSNSTQDPNVNAKIQAGAAKLLATLESFGVQAKLTHVTHGPAITRYELQPAPGVKVSRIVNLVDDIALNMASDGVRIEAPIPGKPAVGIEIPNEKIEMVSLRDVLESPEMTREKSPTAVALGKGISGAPVVADMAKMPHVLIAGATGSGKSVCINTIINSIIYRASPKEVRLILIDPKVVELSVYNGIPHLLVPVVTDPKKASAALSWAVVEMEHRYKRFETMGVRNIKGYNDAIGPDEEPMSKIIVIIDELADLMMVAPGEVEESICRLAQLARAAGIHLVIATQRPSVNVITGVIKANIPSRIAFAVSSQIDSRTILDSGGAEKLLGKGDMLYAPQGVGKPTRVQGCFVSDDEVQRIVDYVRGQHSADYNEDVIEQMNTAAEEEKAAAGEAPAGGEPVDEMLAKAIELAVEAGQVSISMLQRRLRVGYARAGRLVDEMTLRGITGEAEGPTKPRTVLISREEWRRMQENQE